MLKVSESHATTLEFHRRAVEKAWKDQELHSLGVNTVTRTHKNEKNSFVVRPIITEYVALSF
jgi:hypothetical protein